MPLSVKLAECNKPLERSNEDQPKDHTNSLQEDNNGVDLNIIYGFPKVVIDLISVDQKVPAKESRESEAEEETFQVDEGLDQEENGCENSEPLE